MRRPPDSGRSDAAAARQLLAGLSRAAGGELKWGAWNTCWHTVNSGLVDVLFGDAAEDKRRAAGEDLERARKHLAAAQREGGLSAASVGRVQEQAEQAGRTALKAVLAGNAMPPEDVVALPPPSNFESGLWERVVAAVRLAAASMAEQTLAVSPETWHHWHKGQALEKEFERAWNAVYERPPTPPPPLRERTVPPRPLTVEWLAEHGDIPGPAPIAAREEFFPSDLDEGMVSRCLLLWIKPSRFGPEQCYVAKRSLGGVAEHWTAGSLITEYRFYDKVVRHKAWPKAAELLARALHVPKLLVANLGPPGRELEGFVLVMERLAGPAWLRVEPVAGCSRDQALAAVGALGRLHGHFADTGKLGALTFLGVKPVGGEGQFEGGYMGCFFSAAATLRGCMSSGAFAVCQKMAFGSVSRVAERLRQPPLTLLHGDFKLENLRFSGATGRGLRVAAFDFGLVTRGRGAWDFAYFLAHGIEPRLRRELDQELVQVYLKQLAASTAEDRGERVLAPVSDVTRREFEGEVRSALLCVLGKLIIVHSSYQGDPEISKMLLRNLQWAAAAVEDWDAGRELP